MTNIIEDLNLQKISHIVEEKYFKEAHKLIKTKKEKNTYD